MGPPSAPASVRCSYRPATLFPKPACPCLRRLSSLDLSCPPSSPSLRGMQIQSHQVASFQLSLFRSFLPKKHRVQKIYQQGAFSVQCLLPLRPARSSATPWGRAFKVLVCSFQNLSDSVPFSSSGSLVYCSQLFPEAPSCCDFF